MIGMRILHLTPYYAPSYAFGGVVRALEGLAEAQVAAGHSVRILTSDTANLGERLSLPPRETHQGVEIFRAPNRWPALRQALNLSSPRGMGALAETLLQDADIVHCHEFRTVENWLLADRLRAMKRRLPLLLSPHGTLPHETGRRSAKAFWDATLGPNLARVFDHVVCLSEIEREDVNRRWRAMRVAPPPTSVIPNGVNLDIFAGADRATLRAEFRRQHNLADAPTMLFLGRLHRRKGVSLLARAFGQLAERDARLLIVGPDEGERAVLRELADERISLLGYLQGEERLAALAAADGFALPAIGEGLSMALLEALAAGLPAIITPGCNLPQVAERGAGWLVAPAVESIADALTGWLAEATRWPAMAAAGRWLAREEFSWPSLEAALAAVYRDLRTRISSAAKS